MIFCERPTTFYKVGGKIGDQMRNVENSLVIKWKKPLESWLKSVDEMVESLLV